MNTDNTVLEYWKERAIRFEEKFNAVNNEVLYLQSKISSTPAGEDVEALALETYCTPYGKPNHETYAFIAGYKAALQNKVPVERYVPVSVDDEMPPTCEKYVAVTGTGDYHLFGRYGADEWDDDYRKFLKAENITHWLKKTTLHTTIK
jgi:hypothetical protein